MNTVIRIHGLEELINRIESYKSSLPAREREYLERLAEIGVDVAKVRFSSAQYDGTNDVKVNAPQWVDGNRIAVCASGNAVTFIEFGTGVFYTEQHPLANEMGMERGGFGQGKGSQSTWGYYGEGGTNGKFLKSTDKGDLYITHGNPPARAMYEASKEMRDKALEIAKEVFSFD